MTPQCQALRMAAPVPATTVAPYATMRPQSQVWDRHSGSAVTCWKDHRTVPYVLARLTGLLCLALLVAPLPAVHAASLERTATSRLRVAWATFLSGSSTHNADDYGTAIATDPQGNIYVTGSTGSHDFPVMSGAQHRRKPGRGYESAFVAAYDRASRMRWTTYLGGSNSDTANAVATDGQGNTYVSGVALSTDFPVTAGASQPTNHGGPNLLGGFVASYRPGCGLRWSTYLGGTNDDTAEGIATGLQGQVLVAGSTRSYDFPVTQYYSCTSP